VDQVVRGDDLLDSAPRQAYLAHLLDLPEVEYVHVPLVLGPTGQRLAKRDGAVTLRQLPGASYREKAAAARAWIDSSIGPDALGDPALLSHAAVTVGGPVGQLTGRHCSGVRSSVVQSPSRAGSMSGRSPAASRRSMPCIIARRSQPSARANFGAAAKYRLPRNGREASR
jgi:hypothetical protein